MVKSILHFLYFFVVAFWIKRLYNKDQEVISRIFLVSVLLSVLVERFFVSHMPDFFYILCAWLSVFCAACTCFVPAV